MRRSLLVFLPLITVMPAIMPATAQAQARTESASAESASTGKVRARDLTIIAPQMVYLAAPPYIYPGGIVTYGGTATLLQVREGATAINPEVSKKPENPGRGFRWAGLKLTLTNTGSQDATFH